MWLGALPARNPRYARRQAAPTRAILSSAGKPNFQEPSWRKPRIFIASSVESLPIAEAATVNLDREFEVSPWPAGTFKLSSTAVDDLATKASSVDFALFVFSPEDLVVIRNKTEHVARDNVVFELGLFIGAIGRERCFILKPRGQELHLPSDLAGINYADFEPIRTDKDMES